MVAFSSLELLRNLDLLRRSKIGGGGGRGGISELVGIRRREEGGGGSEQRRLTGKTPDGAREGLEQGLRPRDSKGGGLAARSMRGRGGCNAPGWGAVWGRIEPANPCATLTSASRQRRWGSAALCWLRAQSGTTCCPSEPRGRGLQGRGWVGSMCRRVQCPHV